ncbi:MAG: tetratricopeptide repeat protein, partial [Bdellovibrionales bacterium]|nr:tetratricopeptide repeat protein [Bdellovibrionales bacterium]
MTVYSSDLALLPAPTPTAVFPISEETLETALEADPSDATILFALANLYAQSKRIDDACDLYERILADDPNRSDVRCNLGIVLSRAGEYEAALKQLKRSILGDPLLDRAKVEVATILVDTGKPNEARELLESMLESGRLDAAAITQLAALSPTEERREQLLEQGLEKDESYQPARILLAELFFARTLSEFSETNLIPSMVRWAAIYERFPEAFYSSQRIVQEVRRLAKTSREGQWTERAIRQLVKSTANSDAELPRLFYLATIHELFDVELLPALFIPQDALDSERAFWSARAVEQS